MTGIRPTGLAFDLRYLAEALWELADELDRSPEFRELERPRRAPGPTDSRAPRSTHRRRPTGQKRTHRVRPRS